MEKKSRMYGNEGFKGSEIWPFSAYSSDNSTRNKIPRVRHRIIPAVILTSFAGLVVVCSSLTWQISKNEELDRIAEQIERSATDYAVRAVAKIASGEDGRMDTQKSRKMLADMGLERTIFDGSYVTFSYVRNAGTAGNPDIRVGLNLNVDQGNYSFGFGNVSLHNLRQYLAKNNGR